MDLDDADLAEGEDGIVRFSETDDPEYPERIQTGPWDVNFGTHYDDDENAFSGIANKTVTLLGGKNGSGKSTVAMHIINAVIEASNVKDNPLCTFVSKLRVDKKTGKVLRKAGERHKNCHRRDMLYISAEEGNNALRSRAKRLAQTQIIADHFLLCPLGQKINLDGVLSRYKPIGIIGDSISKMIPDPVKAVEWCDQLRTRCEQHGLFAILINHINKDGDQAGMESLQHSVDCVQIFSIDTDKIRMIETIKNRNGEDGVRTLYKMTRHGLLHRPDLEAELNGEDDEEEEDEEYDDDDEEEEDDE